MSSKNDYTIIGIDGGGTNTRGILHRDGKVLAEAKSGTTRVGAVGVGESCERTLNVVIDLCKQAEIESTELDAVVVGLAGVWLEEEKMRSANLLKTLARGSDLVFGDLTVTSDAELAMEGAFAGGNGIITIVGTGSIALGKKGNGDYIRCGGWGIELDDEGSGAWIGREGLTAVVREIDGRGTKTKLTKIIDDMVPQINLALPRTIVKAYSEGAFQYHMFTPAIMECALQNDKVCLNIIERAAEHLAELPNTLVKSYKAQQVEVALLGGIIEADTLLANMLKKELKKNKKITLIEPKGSALDGAIAIGSKMIEMDVAE